MIIKCKFINIQQSTKTAITTWTVSFSVSLSISNRVLKPISAPSVNSERVSLSISNRVLKLSFLANLGGQRVSLSISNRVLKRPAGELAAKKVCKFINIQQSTKTTVTTRSISFSVSLSISNRVLKLKITLLY